MRIKRCQRQGAVLVAVLVCMGVATAIVLSMVKTSISQRRQLRHDLQMEQTKWMLDAGVRNAIASFEKDAEFVGGTIELMPAIARFDTATVETEVKRDEESANSVRLKVTAEIRGMNDRAMVTKRSTELVFEVPD